MSQATAEVELEVVATTAEARREQAVRRVKKRRDFQTHLVAYLVINVVVWGIWVVIGANSHSWFPWPLFMTLGWGIGVAMNAWDVYFRRPIAEEEIRQEMQRLSDSSNGRQR
jgi:fatty acid desaturase